MSPSLSSLPLIYNVGVHAVSIADEKNVAEISYECGYNNISHFNHQFKFITGKKPLEYKRDYLKEE